VLQAVKKATSCRAACLVSVYTKCMRRYEDDTGVRRKMQNVPAPTSISDRYHFASALLRVRAVAVRFLGFGFASVCPGFCFSISICNLAFLRRFDSIVFEIDVLCSSQFD